MAKNIGLLSVAALVALALFMCGQETQRKVTTPTTTAAKPAGQKIIANKNRDGTAELTATAPNRSYYKTLGSESSVTTRTKHTMVQPSRQSSAAIQDEIIMEQLVQQAESLSEAGQDYEAEATVLSVLQKDPLNTHAQETYHNILRNLNKENNFYDYLFELLEQYPNEGSLYIKLATIYREFMQLEEAEQTLRAAVNTNPEDLELHRSLADFLSSQEQLDEALELYNAYIASDTTNPYGYEQLAGIYNSLGEKKKAEEMYKKAGELAATANE